ncbi:MAG: glycosyltransferase family 4 protein [Pseudomarimonas sp.]
MATHSRRSVLFVAPSSYLLSGLASWLDYLLPGLRQRGWDATLGLVEGPRYHRPEKYLAVHPDPQSVAISCRTGTEQGRRHALRQTLRALRPDVVVCVNIPHSVFAVADERAAGQAMRALISCHGIQHDLFTDMHALQGLADAVACTNRLACRLAEVEAGWLPERIFHAPCGAALGPLRTANKPAHGLNLTFVGRLEEAQKRVRDLPPMFAALKKAHAGWRLRIAGTGPEEHYLRKSFAELGLSGDVEFLGHVPGALLGDEVYGRADVLLMPSRWETGPIVIWEAMAEGVPVVTSDYLGNGLESALIDGHNCLKFDVGDTSGAALQIERLRQDPSLSATLRRNARELIERSYSEDASIRQWHKVLEEVLALPALPPAANRMLPSRTRGAMDRFVGPENAERLRRLLRRRGPDSGPGGEWPHTLGARRADEAEFIALAEREDRVGERMTSASASSTSVPDQPC